MKTFYNICSFIVAIVAIIAVLNDYNISAIIALLLCILCRISIIEENIEEIKNNSGLTTDEKNRLIDEVSAEYADSVVFAKGFEK